MQDRLGRIARAKRHTWFAGESYVIADQNIASADDVRQLFHLEPRADGLALTAKQRFEPEEPKAPARHHPQHAVSLIAESEKPPVDRPDWNVIREKRARRLLEQRVPSRLLVAIPLDIAFGGGTHWLALAGVGIDDRAACRTMESKRRRRPNGCIVGIPMKGAGHASNEDSSCGKAKLGDVSSAAQR